LRAALSEDKLADYKRSLSNRYLEPSKTLEAAASRVWGEIHDRTLLFERRQLLAAATAKVCVRTRPEYK
jgi:secreted Zn-dependent insulinase-like peptidase